jgi:hypothetical protein
MGTNFYLYDWYGNRTHLAKTSGGWVPGIHDTEHYDSYPEFVQFVKQHGHIVKDEYGRRWDVEDFLERIEDFRDNNDRRHDRSDYTSAGFDFIGGEWS